MALQKTLLNTKGQFMDYHKILSVSQDYSEGKQFISINIASYTNADYREKEKTDPNNNMIVANTGFALPMGETEDFSRATLYSRIKAEIPDFADAIDC